MFATVALGLPLRAGGRCRKNAFVDSRIERLTYLTPELPTISIVLSAGAAHTADVIDATVMARAALVNRLEARAVRQLGRDIFENSGSGCIRVESKETKVMRVVEGETVECCR